MMRRLTTGLALSALAVLGACSQGVEQTPLQVEVFQSIGQAIQSRSRSPQAARPPLTRAALDTVEGPYIEVTLESNGVFAYLSQQLVRRDDTPGEIVLWRTEDNITLALRAGVLTASRGLGDDLLSASALMLSLPQGGSRTGGRSYQIRGLDNAKQSLTLACTLQDLGPDPVEIVGLRYDTRHLQERCEGASGVVVNEYWREPGSGRVWQSRQWAGPGIGYLRIRQLTL
jgi:Group 4 capsule polysaccharide lipoprotein gfcB, YjbF